MKTYIYKTHEKYMYTCSNTTEVNSMQKRDTVKVNTHTHTQYNS